MARPRPPPDTQPPRPTSPSSHRARPRPPSDTHPSRPTSPSSHRARPSRSRARPQLLDSYQLKGSELIIYPGNTVIVRSDPPTDKPYVARIEKIEGDDSQTSHVRILVRWYYHPEETTSGRQAFHGSKELFLSDHTDTQSADTIEGKCTVHTIEDYSRLNSENAADFFCRFEYKPATGAFFPESTDVYCKCKQQYNPDNFMIQCDGCLNWFHPPCIGLSTEEVKQQAQFFCESCIDEHPENKACEDVTKKGAAVLSAKEQGFESANKPAGEVKEHLACEDVSKKGAAVLSAKEQGFESANKPADEVTEHLSQIQDLFVKYDKLWSEKMETSIKNVIVAVNSLLNENANNLQELHGKMTQDLIADIKLILAPSNKEHEIAGIGTSDQIINPHDAAIEKCSPVALIYDERMLAHVPPEGEAVQEIPERLSCIMKKLTDDGLADRCKVFSSTPATIESLNEVHDAKHVKLVDSKSSKLKGAVKSGDMFYSEGTSTAARLAAGSVIQGCDLVVSQGFKSSFAIIRPPGHHVGKKGPPTGFCLLNNICVGAAHLLKQHASVLLHLFPNQHLILVIKKMERILILDFDIHHGDGTEEIFRADNRVLVFSIHRHDGFYPNKKTGNSSNVGKGEGIGYNINVCWQHPGISDADYDAVWDYLLLPVVHEFRPQVILISAGFDAAAGDPLGLCNVTPRGYANMIEKLTSYPIVMALEGGYNLDAISESVAACVRALLGDKICDLEGSLPYDTTYKTIDDTRKAHMSVWRCYKDEIPETIRSRCICKE